MHSIYLTGALYNCTTIIKECRNHNSRYIPDPSMLKVIIPVASECESESKS